VSYRLKIGLCLSATIAILLLVAYFNAPLAADENTPSTYWSDYAGNARLGGGSGDTEATAITITTPEELALFSLNVYNGNLYKGKYVVLKNDIDLAGHLWTPIGQVCVDGKGVRVENMFSGIFDGKGYTIENMVIVKGLYKSKWDTYYLGLFSYVEGVIRNLNLVDFQIRARSVDFRVGSLCCYNSGTIENCNVSGSIKSLGHTGGFTSGNFGVISNCGANVSVTQSGKYDNAAVGGFVGKNDDGTIKNCYVVGYMSGECEFIGGFAGKYVAYYPHETSITNCYSAVEMTYSNNTKAYQAGFCPVGNLEDVSNCYYDVDLLPAAPRNRYEIYALHTAEMRSNDFVNRLNNGGGAWVLDRGAVNGGYPIQAD
jgi:hypothetical protein